MHAPLPPRSSTSRDGRVMVTAMTSTSTDITDAVDTHLEAYGEPDQARRAGLLERVWSEDGRLVDPPAVGTGRQGISALADALQQQFAGHRFRRTSVVDTHNDAFRYTWDLVGPDGTAVLSGLDVGQLASDGKIREIIGFFGDLGQLQTVGLRRVRGS